MPRTPQISVSLKQDACPPMSLRHQYHSSTGLNASPEKRSSDAARGAQAEKQSQIPRRVNAKAKLRKKQIPYRTPVGRIKTAAADRSKGKSVKGMMAADVRCPAARERLDTKVSPQKRTAKMPRNSPANQNPRSFSPRTDDLSNPRWVNKQNRYI